MEYQSWDPGKDQRLSTSDLLEAAVSQPIEEVVMTTSRATKRVKLDEAILGVQAGGEAPATGVRGLQADGIEQQVRDRMQAQEVSGQERSSCPSSFQQQQRQGLSTNHNWHSLMSSSC